MAASGTAVPPKLSLTAEEACKGRQFERELGIMDSPYVCFFARDPSRLKAEVPEIEHSYHDYQDSNVRDYDRALHYLSERDTRLL
jgi:hypothetical protein